MNLIKNIIETEYGLEGEVYFGLCKKFIGLTIEEDSNDEFANKCAILLNELSVHVIDHLCRASTRYSEFFS